MSISNKPKTVLVTGANGFIGNAVARAFVRDGWTTYGLIRNPQAIAILAADEIIPLLGSPGDLSFLDSLYAKAKTFDVIVSVTEQMQNYMPHYNDVIDLLRTLSTTSGQHGIRPLVMFTSGCKDYGMTGLADSIDLSPHTEQSPLNPPPFAANRANSAMKTIEANNDLFDTLVLRPTTVYGLSGSYYGAFFDMASQAAEKEVALELTSEPNSIVHGTHVDDCGDAYVALANHPDRDALKGQCFNISGHRYEKLERIAAALVQEYGLLDQGVKYLPLPMDNGTTTRDARQMLIGFSQWVGSDKLRNEVGWTDHRQLFSEGIHAYRVAYEAHEACKQTKSS